MDDKPARILFDTTTTVETRINTGIQRVVRSLVREALRVDGNGAPRVIPVIVRNGRFHDASAAWRRILGRRDPGEHTTGQRLKMTLEGISPSAARLYGRARVRLRKILYPTSLVRAAGRAYWRYVTPEITFDEDDVLLLLDPAWHRPMWPAVRDARRRGCLVGAVMYDMLPLEYPQFFKPRLLMVFGQWLDNVIDHSGFFLAISETVRASLAAYVHSSRPPEVAARKRFLSFRLGADIPRATSSACVRPGLLRLFGAPRDQAPYLVVGTVEPRKNHHYVLDAFEALWRRSPEAQLCIVGRIGWHCSDVLDRIARHPRAQKSLFVFHDVSDPELSFCYERAKALVTASVAEGFGLPIVEALCHGLAVFASDIPVHREVGGPRCRYFDLRSAECLATLLAGAEQGSVPVSAPDAGDAGVITWSESYRDLLTKIPPRARAGLADPH